MSTIPDYNKIDSKEDSISVIEAKIAAIREKRKKENQDETESASESESDNQSE